MFKRRVTLFVDQSEFVMRAIIQRVSQAEVDVAGKVVGKIGRGLLVYLGVGKEDTAQDAQFIAEIEKHRRCRIVRHTNGITAHLLQNAKTPSNHVIRNRGAKAAGIVVVNIDNKLDADVLRERGLTIPFVGPDNRKGAALAGAHLAKFLETGDPVAIVGGIPSAFNAIQRRLGFEDAMKEAGITLARSAVGDRIGEPVRDGMPRARTSTAPPERRVRSAAPAGVCAQRSGSRTSIAPNRPAR